MKDYTRVIKEYQNIGFRYTKGKIDIFNSKQFHSYYEIYLFLGGKAEFLNDHTKRPLFPNNLIIIPPGDYHCLIVEEDFENYERCVLNIHPSFLDENILKEAFKSKEISELKSNHRIIENFIYLKETAEKSNQTDYQYILSAIATDIIFLIKQLKPSLKDQSNGSLSPVSVQIMDYINKNYRSNITLQDIADSILFSPSSISHIFKKDFEVSIKKYITEKRMNEIYILLQKGEKPLTVANDFGFSNYSTFYRCFKGHFNKSPSEINKATKREL